MTRSIIIESAYELFGKNGYEATSIASVVKKAKITKGALYHYFDSKEELFVETLQYCFTKHQLTLTPQLSNLTPRTYIPFLLDVGKYFIHIVTTDTTFAQMFFEIIEQARKNKTIQKKMKPHMQKYMDQFVELFTIGQKFGLIKNRKPQILAIAMMMQFDAIIFRTMTKQTEHLLDVWEYFVGDIQIGA